MEDLYGLFLDSWRDAGGTLFMPFSSCGRYTKWGSWGAFEWQDEVTTPKYEALLEFMAANPRW